MYLKSIDGLKGWDGQSPPTIRHQVGKPVTQLDTIVDQVDNIDIN
jgi:dihydropyrimidine dehydrogenase (NADP+)